MSTTRKGFAITDVEGLQQLADALMDSPDEVTGRHLSDEEFAGYVADSLSEEVVRELDLHLESCEECVWELDRIATAVEAILADRKGRFRQSITPEQVRSESRIHRVGVEKLPEPRVHRSGGTVSRSRGGLFQESVRRHILLEKFDALVRNFPPRWRGFEEAKYRMLMAIGAGVDQSIELVSQASGLEPPEGLGIGAELVQSFESLALRHLASGVLLPPGATFESWLQSSLAPESLKSLESILRLIEHGPRPALQEGMVFEFVRAAHDDLGRVKELLRKEPRLVNASWNWGCGDWETAQGAAGHMGNKEALEFLLSEGAEMDIFCAATLGKVEVIEPLVATHPEMANAKGPHGISLIEHARAGEQDEVVELLRYYGAA